MADNKTEIDAILDIVAKNYEVSPALLRQPIGTLTSEPTAREASIHAMYVLKLKGFSYTQISHLTQNGKGTISRVTSTSGSEIGGRLDITKKIPTVHQKDQQMHAQILEDIRLWKEETVANQESYFEGEDTDPELEQTPDEQPETVADTPPLTALPVLERAGKVENPLFQNVINQATKEIPVGPTIGVSESAHNFVLPEDDGVPEEPNAPKHTAQTSPFASPTDTSAQAITPNTNKAQFATNVTKNILPVLVVPFTQIDVSKVESLEDEDRLPEGTLQQVEKQNEYNAKKIKDDIKTQVDLVQEPLGRALGKMGIGDSPITELVISLMVMFGMLALSIFTMRQQNEALLTRLKREYKRQKQVVQTQA